jgi:hypothetical protein
VNFKQNVWNDKTLSKPRSMNAAAVREDMVANTSMKNANIEGYPSVFLVGKDKKAVNIKTPASSEELVEMMNKTANVTTNADTNVDVANNDSNNVINENSGEESALPPNVTSDRISNSSEQRGGGFVPAGLYDMLLKGAPAALLAGAAVSMTGGKSRRSRRSSRRSLRKKTLRRRK